MREIIVGDVHGCIVELQELVAQLELKPDDHLIFLGDLVDRGPDSPAVVRYARSLRDLCKVTLVQGNHEDKHRRWWRHIERQTGHETRMKAHEEIASIQKHLTPEDREFLWGAPLLWTFARDGSVCVHGGVCPSTPPLKNADQRKEVFRTLLFMRFIDGTTHKPVSLFSRKPGDVIWSDVYDGRFGRIFYGHQPYPDDTAPVLRGHTVGLDLGCVFGGSLCAFIIDDNGQEDYRTVKAKKTYATHFDEVQE